MDIRQEELNKKGAFFIEEDGERVAQIQYLKSAEGEITINHTEVDERLRGEGIGEDLVARAVDFAREKRLRIVAECPYARKVLEGTAEFRDVLV